MKKTRLLTILLPTIVAFGLLSLPIAAEESDWNVTENQESHTPENALPDDSLEEEKHPCSRPIPDGSGTVIDYTIDAEGKVFYTIITEDKHVFYLIIDNDKNSKNVYFLNAVTVSDLLSLAVLPLVEKEITPKPTITVTPSEPTPQAGINGTAVFCIMVATLGLIGGTIWYVKVYRKKKGLSSDRFAYSESEYEESDQ